MFILIWIYAWIFACCAIEVQSNYSKSKNKSIWKPQRVNSKMSKEFLNRKFSREKLIPWIERLRKLQQKRNNSTEDLNEIPDDLDPKIVNGRPAAEREFRWMGYFSAHAVGSSRWLLIMAPYDVLYLLSKYTHGIRGHPVEKVALHFNGRFICSAFLISPTIVMTAAHCVEFENGVEPASAFYGIIGNIRREGPETRIDFREVASHPNYGSGSEYDIAVLRTATNVAMTDSIEAICLPTADRDFDLVYIQAMGWGAQSSEMPEAPEVLMTTELGTLPKSACRFFFALLGITITDKHICSNSFRPTGVCFGDSGGPGVYDDPSSGRKVAVGVASFITFLGCGRPLVPSVYTRIASYIDWLTKTVVDVSDICFV